MADALLKATEQLSRRYLGTAGIHGVGLSRSNNTIYLYVVKGGSKDDQERMLREINSRFKGLTVVLVEGSPPKLS